MSEENCVEDLDDLKPKGIIGFNGHVQRGLCVHPNKRHVIFPIGNKVSIMEFSTHKQDFLSGHTNDVSAIAVSRTGKMIASGQINHMGFKSYVIVWNFGERTEIFRHEVHKVRIQALSFTCDESYLISLGGRDDGKLVVWDIEKNAPVCGSPATKEVTGIAKTIVCLPHHTGIFLTAGNENLRLWYLDLNVQKLRVFDVVAGKLRRDYNGLRIMGDLLYAGTSTGDIVKIKLNCITQGDSIAVDGSPCMLGSFGRHNPKKKPGKDCELYTGGVKDILIIADGVLLIGSGDGSIELVRERDVHFKDYPSPSWPKLSLLKKQKVNGPVTSLQLLDSDTVLIGTDSCEIYTLNLAKFDLKLSITCNISTVYDIAFPHDFSQVFATASYQSVRIWSTTKLTELLRIIVTNFSAAAIAFTADGKSIVSGWNDGVIRSFTPLTGKLIYAIPNAHNKGCSALAISRSGRLIISGGVEGQVRIWKIEPTRQSLIGILKEHTGAITALDFNFKENELVSSSIDGRCIIWDLDHLMRKHVLSNKNQFTCAKFFPTGVQVLTSGSNKNVCYWECYDGALVRDVQATKKGAINCISLNTNGSLFVTGGNDQLIKLWDYQLGVTVAIGVGHAAAIVTVQYSPCGKLLVTGSADGAVFIWDIPKKHWPKPDYNPLDPDALQKAKESLQKSKKKSAEHIEKLETSRSNQSVHISECPDVSSSCQPEVGSEAGSI